ncbi:MAG: hypothetical protein HFI00_16215 [Lachnospiraceae bacterium]|jgi:hypothetical protein|nr:hypothetical protein [Lachnospiraceae bacterium]
MIKKGLKKGILFSVSVCSLSLMLVGTCGISVHASEVPEKIVASEEGVAPHSAMIEWRYKFIDGVLYRRLYNYTEECWVGEWEVCPWESLP